MNTFAKRNKINKFLMLFKLCSLWIISLIILMFTFLWLTISLIDNFLFFILAESTLVFTLISLFIKNFTAITKIINLINSVPEYYIELNNSFLNIHSLDGFFTIELKDITKLNYSYDRCLIASELLQQYGNKYKLNTNSIKLKSMYTLFDLSREYVPIIAKTKPTTHGILFITTQSHFFILPEISNVLNDFETLKTLCPNISYNTNTNNYIHKIYDKITECKDFKDLNNTEQKVVNIINMFEHNLEFSTELSIQFLAELQATNYLQCLYEFNENLKTTTNKSSELQEDIVVQLLNKLEILNEEDPFYENYLIPYIKEHNLDTPTQ